MANPDPDLPELGDVASFAGQTLSSSISSGGSGPLQPLNEGTLLRSSFNLSSICGTVRLDKTEVTVGEKVGVYWDIPGATPHNRDWIGIFEAVEENPEGFLDWRRRGENQEQHGHISWVMDETKFRGQYLRAAMEVYFCFYSHTNLLLAKSSSLLVSNRVASPYSLNPLQTLPRNSLAPHEVLEPFQIKVFSIYCTGLRSKTFGHPDPYLKLQLTHDRGSPKLPHHRQKAVSTVIKDSVYPVWSEYFTFSALPSDILEVEVRDKFSATRPSVSHFLGKVKVPLCQFLRWRGLTSLTFALQKRLPSDRVTGTISLSVHNNHLDLRPEEAAEAVEDVEQPSADLVAGQSSPSVLPPSTQSAIVHSPSYDSVSSEEDHTPLVSLQGIAPAGPQSDDIILLNMQPEAVGEEAPREDLEGDPASAENASSHPGAVSAAAAESRQDSITESIQENPSQSTVSVASEGAPVITFQSHTAAPERQMSHPPELNQIRQTLCGSRPRRSSSFHTHSSVYTSRSRDRSHDRPRDLISSVVVLQPVSSPQDCIPEDVTESLPPNWEVRTSEAGHPLYYDHRNKIVVLDRPGTSVALGALDVPNIDSFLRRSKQNLFSRQASQPPNSIPEHHALERSLTVTYRFPSERPILVKQVRQPQDQPVSKMPSGDSLESAESVNIHQKKSVEGVTRDSSTKEVEVEPEEISQEGVNENEEGGGIKVEIETVEEHALARTGSIDEKLRDAPSFKFITRHDLYKFAKDDGNEAFFTDLAALELINAIRSDYSLFSKYQHSSKLVQVLNSFARTDCDLPTGWEKKVDRKTGKHVFVDHNSCRTTFIDPRLPYPGNDLKVPTSQHGVVARSRPYATGSEPLRQPRPSPPSPVPSRSLSSPTPPPLPPRFSRSLPSPPPPRPLPPLPPPSPPPPPPHPPIPYSREFPPPPPPLPSYLTSPPPPSPFPPPPGPLPPVPYSREFPPPPPPLPSYLTSLPPPPAPIRNTQSLEHQELSYSERVVAFLRQPNIFDLLRSRYDTTLSFDLRAAIESIQQEGASALETMQSEMDSLYLDLTIILSLFEQEIAHCAFPLASPTTNQTTDARAPLPPPPPPPPAAPTLHRRRSRFQRQETPEHDVPDVNTDDHTFMDLSMNEILEFFRDSQVYRHVLSRFNGISARHRVYIQSFEDVSPEELEERLWLDGGLRRFIHRLRDDIRPVENATTEGTDGIPNIVNHRFDGMTMPQIVEFFRGAEQEMEREVGVLELSPEELEALLQEDEEFRTLIHQFRDEIIRLPALPMASEIRAYFGQLNRDFSLTGSTEVLEQHAIQLIMGLSDTLLQERLTQDPFLRGFVESHADDITAFSARQPPPPPIPPRPPTPASGGDPPRGDPPRRGSIAEDVAFVSKLQTLQRKLDRNGYASSDYREQVFQVKRDSLLQDAYHFIMGTPAKKLRRQKCNIKWSMEEGLDYGGPQREFFFKLSRLLFNPYYGLFEYSAQGSYTIQISPQSAQIEDALQWFRFAGRIIGYSVIQGHLLDVFFARHIYKALLRRPYTVSDVESLDLGFYNSLRYVLDSDPAPLELTFTVLEESFGEMVEVELKPGGTQVAVTEENKREYVDLMVQWRLARGVGKQTEMLVKGLKEMLPLAYLEPFDSQELEWVIAGTPEIDMRDWKENTDYWGGYHKDDRIIKWFWDVVEAFSNEQKLRLLQFVTGTSSIPFEGFKALRGSSSLQRFTIDSLSGSQESLPIAHTCFNRLDLPRYSSLQQLREKLTQAIEECESFENA